MSGAIKILSYAFRRLAPLMVACALFAAPVFAEDEFLNPRMEDPLNALRPPEPQMPDGLDTSINALPDVQPPPPVQKRDKPRTAEPMEDYTQYYDPKVFGVPAGRAGQTLSYYWKAPAPYHPKDKRYPLVVVLHDSTGVAHAAQHLIKKQMRKDYPAYIMIPVLPTGPIWAFPSKFPDEPRLAMNLKKEQALESVIKLVQDVQQSNQIDPSRLYIVGCGEGGFGVFGTAARYSDFFAAGVAISGGWTIKEAPKMTKFPLFVMHGQKDKKFEPGLSRNVAFYIQQFGGRKISFVEVPGMEHDCGNHILYSPTTWQWLFAQKKK